MSEKTIDQVQETSFSKLNKFYEIEVQQVFETIIQIQNFRIQYGIFFGTINIGGIGIGLTTGKAGIVLLSSLLIIAYMIIDYLVRRSLYAMYYRANQLQERFAPNDPDTFLTIFRVGRHEKGLSKIANISNRDSRNKALLKLPIEELSLTGFLLPLGAFLLEVVFGLYLWLVMDWDLF